MSGLLKWLKLHTYEAHLLAFLLMTLSPVLLYYSARQGLAGLTWGLLATVIIGNLIALWVR